MFTTSRQKQWGFGCYLHPIQLILQFQSICTSSLQPTIPETPVSWGLRTFNRHMLQELKVLPFPFRTLGLITLSASGLESSVHCLTTSLRAAPWLRLPCFWEPRLAWLPVHLCCSAWSVALLHLSSF